jgi:hypothetical protein
VRSGIAGDGLGWFGLQVNELLHGRCAFLIRAHSPMLDLKSKMRTMNCEPRTAVASSTRHVVSPRTGR